MDDWSNWLTQVLCFEINTQVNQVLALNKLILNFKVGLRCISFTHSSRAQVFFQDNNGSIVLSDSN